MMTEHDLPHFKRFIEVSVAEEVGGVIAPEDFNLIGRVITTLIGVHRGNFEGMNRLSQEIAALKQDTAHHPEHARHLDIIVATKRLSTPYFQRAV